MTNTATNIFSAAANAANAASNATTNTSKTTGTNNSTGSSQTAGATEALNSDFQNFLKLLTTQLQNQDPTQPADVNQMTQEIAMLSQVEQQINTNKSLEKLVSLFGSTQVNNAVGYIGKQVDAAGNQGELAGGQAIFAYDLPAGTNTADVTITNATGQVVFKGSGTTLAGRNQVIWDGTNSLTGQTMQNGVYTIAVDAKDASGKALSATTLTTGAVTSVDTQNGNTTLMIGDIAIPITNVQSVRNPGA